MKYILLAFITIVIFVSSGLHVTRNFPSKQRNCDCNTQGEWRRKTTHAGENDFRWRIQGDTFQVVNNGRVLNKHVSQMTSSPKEPQYYRIEFDTSECSYFYTVSSVYDKQNTTFFDRGELHFFSCDSVLISSTNARLNGDAGTAIFLRVQP